MVFVYKKLAQFAVRCALPPRRSESPVCATDNCICWAGLLGRAVFPPWNEGPNFGSYTYKLNKQGDNTALTYSFSYLEPVCCSMSSSNCCFLTCIYISQEAGQVVWYTHLFKNFPQFIVIHTVKGFGIVNKVEIDVFLELSCFFDDPADVGNLISGSSGFLKLA